MLFPILLGGSALAGLWYYFTRQLAIQLQTSPEPDPAPTAPIVPVKLSLIDSARAAALTADANLIRIKLGDDIWGVTPDYIGPIGIGEAADLAKSLGMELPTPALVDEIWRQADLKLLPMPRNNVVSQAVFDDQKAKIAAQVNGRSFRLLGGSFKDVVMQGDKFPGLYGWHVSDADAPAFSKKFGIPLNKPITVGPGKPIQPLSGHAHGFFFKDYSQGVRLVKKMPKDSV